MTRRTNRMRRSLVNVATIMFVAATRAPSATEGNPIAQSRLHWQRTKVGTTDVRLRPPSLWTRDDRAHLVVPRDRFGALTEVRVWFESDQPSSDPIRCPATLVSSQNTADVGTQIMIPTEEAHGSRPITLLAPPGSYQLKPDLKGPWKGTFPFAFDPVPVIVGDSPVDVTVRLTRPICLVELDVRDEFARPLTRFMLQTKRFGAVFTLDVPVLAVDGEEWELAIAGVTDAGYLGVPKHTVALQRGRVTTLKYVLQRKE